MEAVGIIPARYQSSRFPGKPLADICGKPMIWWVYTRARKALSLDAVYVATDDQRIADVCRKYEMNFVMTSKDHDTPTSRIYEASNKIDARLYVFIGGDEPLIDSDAVDAVANQAKASGDEVTHAMSAIKTAPEVIDFTNIKVAVSTDGYLLYTSRSPLPFPKGGLDFEYKKFVGIGAFTKKALQLYNDTPKSKLERIEECDLLRFLDKFVKVRMVEVACRNVSVDTPKDLEAVISIVENGRIL